MRERHWKRAARLWTEFQTLPDTNPLRRIAIGLSHDLKTRNSGSPFSAGGFSIKLYLSGAVGNHSRVRPGSVGEQITHERWSREKVNEPKDGWKPQYVGSSQHSRPEWTGRSRWSSSPSTNEDSDVSCLYVSYSTGRLPRPQRKPCGRAFNTSEAIASFLFQYIMNLSAMGISLYLLTTALVCPSQPLLASNYAAV